MKTTIIDIKGHTIYVDANEKIDKEKINNINIIPYHTSKVKSEKDLSMDIKCFLSSNLGYRDIYIHLDAIKDSQITLAKIFLVIGETLSDKNFLTVSEEAIEKMPIEYKDTYEKMEAYKKLTSSKVTHKEDELFGSSTDMLQGFDEDTIPLLSLYQEQLDYLSKEIHAKRIMNCPEWKSPKSILTH